MIMITPTMRALTVATALLAVVVSVRVTNAGAQAPAAPAAGNATTGQTLFTTVGCDRCHGTSGQGTAAAPQLAGSTDELAAFLAYVRNPIVGMPAQSEQVVSDQDLADIYAYLHSPMTAQPDQATESAPAGNADTGAMLFTKVGCYQCHANEAQGGANGPRIGPDPIPFVRFNQYVRNPTGSMPPYTEKVVSPQDLADIYASLQARQRPPAIDTIPLLAPLLAP
jgi:mono/diheme cytochrome c family protein